jgi:hypothetical protein
LKIILQAGRSVAFIGLLLFAPICRSQNAAACPSVKTIDELVKAMDDAISGPADKDRTCMRALFAEGATLSPMTGKDSVMKPTPLTVDGWIERVKQRGSAVFYERQVKYTVESYGSIAHLWSTYEIRDTPDGKARVRGINSIQAVNDGAGWKIFGIVWQAESPASPLPDKYLP